MNMEDYIEPTKEELESMHQQELALAKEWEEEAKKDEALLEKIKKEISKELFEHLEYELKESASCGGFEIVNKTNGENQNEHDYEFWVNQTTNGGYSGDEFTGTCYFKIGKNKYLRWDYAM